MSIVNLKTNILYKVFRFCNLFRFRILNILSSLFVAIDKHGIGIIHSQINYNEKKIKPFKLPDILLQSNGTIVSTIEQWENNRRPELVELFSTYMFGNVPMFNTQTRWNLLGIKNNALNGLAIRKDVKIFLLSEYPEYSLNVQVYLPQSALDKAVPVFLAIALLPNYTASDDPDLEKPEYILIADGVKTKAYERGCMAEFWQLKRIISRGYGIAIFCHQDTGADKPETFLTGIPKLFFKKGLSIPWPDEWGAIAFWAWQMSRVMDYLVIDPMVDSKKVFTIGHSRFGKTALWAAVLDERFAMAISNDSGCGGASLSRRTYGETIEAINYKYPHWFCGNFKQFNNRESLLPFDQHALVALMAPRPVYIASAEDDKWADPKGEFLSAKEASIVYHLYGKEGLECDCIPEVNCPKIRGSIGYHIRKGRHTMTGFDWEQFIKFADNHFRVN